VLPDPDLVIRTSGEARISNFLLWQSAYAEYEFVDTLWPDFTAEELGRLCDSFGRRERRYGAVGA
jgi:undecaprenyl diphosphate synthase